MGLSYWDGAYRNEKKIWGRRPSEIAQAAAEYAAGAGYAAAGKRLLDIGCGYGRDALFLAERWGVRAVGVDPSAQAIEMAEADLGRQPAHAVEFRCARFQEVSDGPYDLVYAANLYQILPPADRDAFVRTAAGLLAPGGLFVLGTLSVRDPEHAGKGTPVPGDPDSWNDGKYVHLSTREELETGFAFLTIDRLYEREYLEPRAGGAHHHHVSWILIGRRHG